jgi:ribosomal protein S18 acetylase RimI-like enzyme
MPPASDPSAARDDELAAAFRLLFGHLLPDARERRVAQALFLVQNGELDRRGILVLRGQGCVAGVTVCLPLDGAAALVWPPRALPPHQIEREDALAVEVRTWLRQRGVKVAQALLPPEDVGLAAPLLRHGFAHVTHLWTLRHDLHPPPPSAPPPRLVLQTHDDDPERFRDTLLRSYEDTLDCPELTGVRTLDEILAGHRAQGLHLPDLWQLALDGGRPVAVLLQAGTPEDGSRDVSYLGVAPEARRRGVGRELLLHALGQARSAGVAYLSLSVDARNGPARELYRALGFRPVERREVFLLLRP